MVVALPHQGNWDWAGAWACATGMPLMTVAERLQPERLYDEFVAFRSGARHADPAARPARGTPLPRLAEYLRQGGFVCLLADRDLSPQRRRGARSAAHPARMPAGPALLARETGAALVPVDPAVRRPGPGDPLPRGGRRSAPGRRGSPRPCRRSPTPSPAASPRHPQDWHMMQRIFTDDPGVPRLMRVGLVCPYSFDVHGGVQNHVLDLAEALVAPRPRGGGARAGRAATAGCRRT